jgi:hypothetical protein
MNKKFWIERMEKYGHTGWSDQINNPLTIGESPVKLTVIRKKQ